MLKNDAKIVITEGFFIFLQFFPNQFDDFEYYIDKNQLLAERLLDLPFFLLYCLAFLCFFDAITEISYNWFLNLCIDKNVLVMVDMKLVT